MIFKTLCFLPFFLIELGSNRYSAKKKCLGIMKFYEEYEKSRGARLEILMNNSAK